MSDVCEFEITGYLINDTIKPSNPSRYYNYYQAEDENTYIDVGVNIKSASEVAQADVFDYVKIVYDDKYEYYCFLVTEEDNGADFNTFTSLYTISPLETLSYHVLAQIPDEVASSSKSLKIIISVNNIEYECTLR